MWTRTEFPALSFNLLCVSLVDKNLMSSASLMFNRRSRVINVSPFFMVTSSTKEPSRWISSSSLAVIVIFVPTIFRSVLEGVGSGT